MSSATDHRLVAITEPPPLGTWACSHPACWSGRVRYRATWRARGPHGGHPSYSKVLCVKHAQQFAEKHGLELPPLPPGVKP